MKFFSLEPFVPSGSDYESSKQLFQELGFNMSWNAGGMAGFEKDGCRFILQNFNDKAFAENFMISVRIENAEEFFEEMTNKNLPDKFGIRISAPRQQPYGKEVNLVDMAGVCWHFVE